MPHTLSIMKFSWGRWWSVVLKEFLQLRRDRVTFAMIVGLPIVQLTLFGYAIDSDPHNLPSAFVSASESEMTRSLSSAVRNTGYFNLTKMRSEEEARRALMRGEKLFVISIPSDFTARLMRGESPPVLVELDGSDPGASGQSLVALNNLAHQTLTRELAPLGLAAQPPPFELRIHRLYNPEGLTRYNIIPGLMGVILTMTMVMMTALAVTRERERGTMENLLSMPLSPLEVMSGKIVPYIVIGLIQSTIIIAAARLVFGVPMAGSYLAIYLSALLFVAANLSVGICISSVARNQLQALQLAIFYFLPSLLLSGFMFPVQGQPKWAQAISALLPLTHFNRLIRGIFLKGAPWADLWPHLWPIALFALIIMALAVKSFKRTLD